MRLAGMLLLHVLVWVVRMRHGRVVVLVVMRGGEMGPLLTGPLIVRDVPVLMSVVQTLVLVLLCHGETSSNREQAD
jgi:hypothetical protein